MIAAAIVTALQVFGIAIVVSMVVALLIKVLVRMSARVQEIRAPEVPTGTVCPVGSGVPEEDVAALSAAIFAMIGPHHILHIGHARPSWSSDGRAVQHSSHTPAASSRRGR